MSYNTTNKISSNTDLFTAVRESNFIVGTYNETHGGISFSSEPTIHTTAAAARNECSRLAAKNHGKTFVFVQFKGLEFVPVSRAISI